MDNHPRDTNLIERIASMGRIRFGRGVVGKSSTVVGVGIVAIAAMGMRAPEEHIMTIIYIIAALVVSSVLASKVFAHYHAEQALLEGAEIIQYRTQEMAAKGLAPPNNAPQVTPPVSPRELIDE